MTLEYRPLQYQLKIITLANVHIGSGNTLRRNFDYVVQGGKTWVVDNTRMAEEILAGGEKSSAWRELLQGRPVGEFLQREDFQPDSPLFRYVMAGEPNSKATGSEIQELLKNPWDQAYLPGSSLKGALRTAFMYVAFEQLKPRIQVSELDSRPKFAAQKTEQSIVAAHAPSGKIPNYDLLRTLQVSDSQPDAQQRLVVCNPFVVTGKIPKAPIVLECIQAGVTFEATLTYDTALLNGIAEGSDQLRFSQDQIKWLYGIRKCASFWAGKRITAELERWKNRSNKMTDYYMGLLRTHQTQPNNAFLIQLGWGGGWDSKTFGDHLTRDEDLFARIVQKYDKHMNKQGKFERGDEYPQSRRVELDLEEKPRRPLGWVQVVMEPVQ